MTKEQVKENIEDLVNKTDEELVHLYKCARSKDKATEKVLLKPFIAAIEKERRKRKTVTTISSKIVQPKVPSKLGANPDDYV